MRGLLPFVLLGGLAGCGTPDGVVTCGPTEARVENVSVLAIEQLYLARTDGSGWGSDLLGQGGLASGANLAIRFAGTGLYSMRVVWVNGRAVEMPGIDGCRTQRIVVLDDGLRAQ
jgi:hypothetical protein